MQLAFSNKNIFNFRQNYFCIYNPFKFLFKNKFFKFIKILYNVFKQNTNILLVDYYNNYNYLPIKNTNLFSRSSKNINKFLTYFNVSVILYLNVNKKKFIFKKLHSNRIINVTSGYGVYKDKFDLSLDIQNNQIMNYIIYTSIMGIYLNIKNNNLNTNGPALFFF